jgi:hypothetical protein
LTSWDYRQVAAVIAMLSIGAGLQYGVADADLVLMFYGKRW